MPILNSLAKVIAKPIPRMISPNAHAVIDYLTIGSFLVSAGFFWGRSKRAALAALICGGTELAVSLLTNYPGGIKKVISFRTHGEIDLGLAAMAATMPEFLAFNEDSEKKFFVGQGALITAVSELTQFPEQAQRAEKGIKRAKVA
ncbi:MAG: hypothetical protein DMG80_07970 [Acidobacteria bacterium]|jgi:hypothetical protein|nr:MAG: hypothetical protein DMG80_07970 [Acidobacteriota bacterium]